MNSKFTNDVKKKLFGTPNVFFKSPNLFNEISNKNVRDCRINFAT